MKINEKNDSTEHRPNRLLNTQKHTDRPCLNLISRKIKANQHSKDEVQGKEEKVTVHQFPLTVVPGLGGAALPSVITPVKVVHFLHTTFPFHPSPTLFS